MIEFSTLCKYKDLFGPPGEGIHSTRIFGMAFADWVMTLLGVSVLSFVFGIAWWKVFLTVFIVAEFSHYMFCVDTAVIKMLKSFASTLARTD